MQQSGEELIVVLHVDDNSEFADMTADLLEHHDSRLTVETACSADEGLRQLATTEYHCVVSDYDMPGQSGISFLKSVRKDYPELPFILFTGKGSEEIASDAIAAGATDYLQKGTGTDQYDLLANRLLNAVEQRRSRERAAKLSRIRTLTSDVNQALVRAESRTQIEESVCQIFANSDPYLFSWIGDTAPGTDRLEPRASAGVEADYLTNISVTVDESSTGQGPGGTAFRERRVAVSQNITEDAPFEPWREDAIERGYRAVAAVPLEYDDTLYGILGIYSARKRAFGDSEKELLAELGTNIGHAIDSIELQKQLCEERDRRQALFENAPNPVIAVDASDTTQQVAEVNDAFEEGFGYDSADIVGGGVAEAIVPDHEMTAHKEYAERAMAGDTITEEVERMTTNGLRTFLLHSIPYGAEGDSIEGTYAWYTDITARKEREKRLESLHAATGDLMTATTTEEIATVGSKTVTEILNLPKNTIRLYDGDTETLVPVAWSKGAEAFSDGPPPAMPVEDSLAGKTYRTSESHTYGDVPEAESVFDPETDIKSELQIPLGEYGVVVAGSEVPNDFDRTDEALMQILAANLETAFERVERESKLTAIHDVANVLTTADTVEQVYNRTIEASEQILEFDLSVINSKSGGVLEPQAASANISSENVHEVPIEDGVVGETYRTGTSSLIDDVLTYEGADREGPYRSVISVPVGDYGVFQAVSESSDAFTDTDLELAELLIEHTESALDRLTRTEQLERKNERLENLTRIVSHDLRNPLNIAQGRVDLAKTECDSTHLADVEQAHTRMETLIEDVLTLAQGGEQVTETRAVAIEDLVEDCWQTVRTGDATVLCDVDQSLQGNPSQLKQLFENLFGNAIAHAGEDVTVTVGTLEERAGFFVADDGPGIRRDRREEVFEPGYSTADDGTGFGLNIVREIIEAHGWEVTVTESEAGGARFEITGIGLSDG